MKKRFLMLVLSFSLILSSSLSAFALAPEDKLIDENQKENIISGFTEINDNQTVVSEVLTFDEIVERIAKDNNISIEEAENQVIGSFDENNKFSLNSSNISPYNATFRTVSSTFIVNSSYSPSLNFYCQTSEGGYFWGIVQILNVGMNRSSNGLTKQFGGSVFTHLENAGRIYWNVNGDFYNNGTTTFNGGVQIKLDESATINFGVSHSTSHYEYVYTQGYYIIR